ncbi:peptidase [Sesbania bispinosa]|nr:peptidase [Sesbania bispinosa]
MEESPKEMIANLEKGQDDQTKQVTEQEGIILEQNNSLKVEKSVSGGNKKEEVGVYVPWMLVKKQPRKKAQVKNKSHSDQVKTPPNGNPKLGSRFELLQSDVLEDQNHQDCQHSYIMPIVAGNLKVSRIHDPKAGKNSHVIQDKRKQQIKKSHKNTNVPKAKLGANVIPKQNIMIITAKTILQVEQPSSSTSPTIIPSEIKIK